MSGSYSSVSYMNPDTRPTALPEVFCFGHIISMMSNLERLQSPKVVPLPRDGVMTWHSA